MGLGFAAWTIPSRCSGVSIVGALSNFDAVNDTGSPCFGFEIELDDVSARDVQLGDGQWARGKSLDTFCPVGEMVPASQVPDPQQLGIRAVLNGEVLQDSNTKHMIFPVAEIIAYVWRLDRRVARARV